MEYNCISPFSLGPTLIFYISWLFAERESAAATGLPASSVDGSTKSGRGMEGGRGRKKYDNFLDTCIFVLYIT